DVRIGHQDDLVVTQVILAVTVAGTAAELLDQVGDRLARLHLFAAGAGDVEDLAPQRQHRLAGPRPRLLGAAAGRIALDDEDLRTLRGGLGAVGQLAGKAKLARRTLPVDLLVLLAPEPVLSPLHRPVEQLAGLVGGGGQPVIESIPQRRVGNPRRLRRTKPALDLAA